MSLQLQPISLKEACRFVTDHHRHHEAPTGGLFAVALNDGETVVAVAIVGRPVARLLADGYTAEVTRLCALEGTPNACSKLYRACQKAASALGYRRLITYILKEEPGTSLKAAGWRYVGIRGGGSWDRSAVGRPRVDTHPTGQKHLWEAA